LIGNKSIIRRKTEKLNEKLDLLLKRFNTLFLNWYSNQTKKILIIR
jgi:hypothetical protein